MLVPVVHDRLGGLRSRRCVSGRRARSPSCPRAQRGAFSPEQAIELSRLAGRRAWWVRRGLRHCSTSWRFGRAGSKGKMGSPWFAIGAPLEKTKSAPLRHWVFSLVGAPPSMAQTCLRLWCARVEHTARRVRTYERRQGLITLGITDGGHGKSTQLARP